MGDVKSNQLRLEERLHDEAYNADDLNAALRGVRVPDALGLEVSRLCVIHGIRHHYGFAQELRGVTPEFTRALNARDIMSDIIPEMSQPEDVPYCIWHPEIPSQEALRKLTKRYPNLIYHAARACAIAGYVDLYKEFDVLPEVHVAEEASYASKERKNEGSEAIYRLIISHHVRFAVFNDYNRTFDFSKPRVAQINGDTAVYSSLAARQAHKKPCSPYMIGSNFISAVKSHDTSHYFNITEDWGIDDHDCDAPPPPEDYFPLLYEPLPVDLPPVDKNKLILVAAYMGDIDRYVRLRRPQMIVGRMRFAEYKIEDEFRCVIRGIYHNVFWAKWWSSQISETPRNEDIPGSRLIRRAINARRIMSDDITWVTDSTPDDLLPINIWWPAVASPEVYERLAHKRPDMLGRCLRACIVADYQDMWDKLLVSSFSSPTAFDRENESATAIEIEDTEAEGKTGSETDDTETDSATSNEDNGIERESMTSNETEDSEAESSTVSETEYLKLRRLSRATGSLWNEADVSRNDHYRRDILAAKPDAAVSLGFNSYMDPSWESHISGRSLYSPRRYDMQLIHKIDPLRLGGTEGAYDGHWAEFNGVEFNVFVRDAIGPDHKIWKEREEEEEAEASEFIDLDDLYEALEANETL